MHPCKSQARTIRLTLALEKKPAEEKQLRIKENKKARIENEDYLLYTIEICDEHCNTSIQPTCRMVWTTFEEVQVIVGTSSCAYAFVSSEVLM